jgi:hypothetical protein
VEYGLGERAKKNILCFSMTTRDGSRLFTQKMHLICFNDQQGVGRAYTYPKEATRKPEIILCKNLKRAYSRLYTSRSDLNGRILGKQKPF